MQIKTTVRYCYIPTKQLKLNKLTTPDIEDVKQVESFMLVGEYNDTITLKNDLAGFYKTVCASPSSLILLLSIFSRKMRAYNYKTVST